MDAKEVEGQLQHHKLSATGAWTKYRRTKREIECLLRRQTPALSTPESPF